MKSKYILRAVAGLVVVLIVLFVAVAFSLGAIVKKAVETIGPSATQVDVKLKGAEVWLFAGRAQLTGFVLGNPPGYKTSTAIAVDNVSVKVKPGSVFSDKLVVETVKVEAPVITLEGGLSDNNLKKIEKNMNAYTGSSSTAPNSAASSSSSAKPEKKLQVNDLVITGARVQVNTTFSAGRTVTLPIPDIHLTSLGTGPEGITPVEVAKQALHAILVSSTEEVAKNATQLGKDALSGATGATKQATDALKGLIH